jgi:hypothetical protein
MIGGPGFDSTAVPRLGPYNPDTDMSRGHAIRLSPDDLYDCGWTNPNHSFPIPIDYMPGIYVGRINYVVGVPKRYDVTFVVRKPSSRPCAPIAVLCNTNTWHAYNLPFAGTYQSYSFYEVHAGNMPTYLQGINMPWNYATDPYALKDATVYPNYGHLVKAERQLHTWLEIHGYNFDVLTDRDLHVTPGVLLNYREVMIAGHSEYWSAAAYQAVVDYLAAGKKLISASGNTMFWRVSYGTGTTPIIECRKRPEGVGGYSEGKWGETYHQADHKRGGLMREAGSPAWKVVGLECVGYDGGPMVPYQVEAPAHAFFTSPEVIPVVQGTQIGGADAVGHEWDATLNEMPPDECSNMMCPPPDTPAKPTLPQPGYTPVVLAKGRDITNGGFRNYAGTPIASSSGVMSQIIDWQKTGGGRVFAAGSINAGHAVHGDNKMASLFRNALHHHGIVFKLGLGVIGSNGHVNYKFLDGTNWSLVWQDLGTGFFEAPVAIQWGPSSLALIAIDNTGDMKYNFSSGDAWSGFTSLGKPTGVTLQGRPAVVNWGRNRLEIFARGSDNHIWQKSLDGSWSVWSDVGSGAASNPTAAVWEGTRLGVAMRDAAGAIKYRYNIDGVWNPAGGWDPVLGPPPMGTFIHAPTLLSWGGNRLNVFAVDNNSNVFYKHWNGLTWGGWTPLRGPVGGRIHCATWGRDQFSLFSIGADGHLNVKWWTGSSWGPSQLGVWDDRGTPAGTTLVGEPAVISYRGTSVCIAAVGVNSHLYRLDFDGFTWGTWQDMSGNMIGRASLFRWI